MSSGFQGFLQGFASTGAEIVKEQDKQKAAANLFLAEHIAAANIDAKMKQLQDGALIENDKAAIMGNSSSNLPQGASSAAPPTQNPALTAAATPTDPQAANTPAPSNFNVAIAGNESSYGKNLQNPTSSAAGSYGAINSTASDPGFGVKPAQDNSMAERTRVGSDYADAMLKKYNGNPILASLAHYKGPGFVDNWLATTKGDPTKLPADARQYVGDAVLRMSTQNGAAPAPTAQNINTPQSVTPEERTRALADIRAKGDKNPFTTDQLNQLALKNRETEQDTNQKQADEHSKAQDSHVKTLFDMGQTPDSKSVYAPDPDFAQVHGVPVLPANANDGKHLNSDKVEKIQTSLSADAQKAGVAAEKIRQDVETYKSLLKDTTTGGVANAAQFFRENLSPSIQIMNGVSKDLLLSQVGAGTGINRLTNMEMGVIAGGTANTKMKPEAAIALLNKVLAQATLAEQYSQYKSDYFGANTTMKGADDTFKKYLKDSPLFAANSTNYEMNPDRMTTAEFFWGDPAQHKADTLKQGLQNSRAAVTNSSIQPSTVIPGVSY